MHSLLWLLGSFLSSVSACLRGILELPETEERSGPLHHLFYHHGVPPVPYPGGRRVNQIR